jgi:hypothetical protein
MTNPVSPIANTPDPTFGDYLVFVDESGDHGLTHCDPEYPLFVLAFCVMTKRDYAEHVTPELQRFKFAHFGHDIVVLHETDIRKARRPFTFLLNPLKRALFYDDLNALMDRMPITVVSVVVHKSRLIAQYTSPTNPYHLGLEYGLERVSRFLVAHAQAGKTTPLICECRGKREDDELELEFRRVATRIAGFEIHFVDKKANLPGLQIADLVARPIGQHVLNPEQPNRAYEIIEKKLRRGPSGQLHGYGLKIFPEKTKGPGFHRDLLPTGNSQSSAPIDVEDSSFSKCFLGFLDPLDPSDR